MPPSTSVFCYMTLPFLTLSGDDWTFTRLLCLTREQAGTLAAGTASAVWGLWQWGLYDLYFTENVFCARYRRMRVICICEIYAWKYGICQCVSHKDLPWRWQLADCWCLCVSMSCLCYCSWLSFVVSSSWSSDALRGWYEWSHYAQCYCAMALQSHQLRS